MTRARHLSYLLWSVLAAGCGDDDSVGHLPDAPMAPVTVPAITLGAVPALSTTCGQAAPAPFDLLVTNTGTADLVISAATATGGFAVTTTLPLTIAAGGHATVSVRAPAAVIGTDRGGSMKTGTLTITSNITAAPTHTVELAALVMGANLVFTDEADQPIAENLAFSSNSTCPLPANVRLRNTGNLAIVVGNHSSASGFAFDGFSGGTIEAGAFATQLIEVRTDFDCQGSASVAYEVTGIVCTTPTVTLPVVFNINQSSCSC